MSKEFNPADFGIITATRKKGGDRINGCYLRMKDNGAGRRSLELVFDSDTTDLAKEMFGCRVDAGYDKKGRVFIFKPSGVGRKILSNSSVGTRKSYVSLSSVTDEYASIMGKFKRLYVEPDLYAGGGAIVFTPNGNRDML